MLHWIHWLPSSFIFACLYATSAPTKNLPARSAEGPLLPSEPSSIFTDDSFTSLVDGTDPLLTLLPLSRDADVATPGEGPGESAAPSISSFCLLGLRDLEVWGLRGGSISLAVRKAVKMPTFLITSFGSSLRIFCSSSDSFRPSRYKAASSSRSFTDGAEQLRLVWVSKSIASTTQSISLVLRS